MKQRNIKYIFNNSILVLFKQIARIIAFLWPRNKQLVAVGAWMGKSYSDSPKYLVKYLLENSKLNIVWIGNEDVKDTLPSHPRLTFRRKDSISAMLSLLRAGTWVCCISIEWDLTSWPIEGFATTINTWHGYSFKKSGNKVGVDSQKQASLLGGLIRKISLHSKPWVMVGSERDALKLLIGDPDYFSPKKILRVGTPTNDYLIHNQNNALLIKELKMKIANALNFNPSMKVISYLPTWRNSGQRVFSFYSLGLVQQTAWKEMLCKHNAVLLEKHHPRTLEDNPVIGESQCSIPISADEQKNIDVFELLLITDVLITDYSGTGQDFGVLERPCLYFLYDIDDYMINCSGLVDGWENMLAGPIIHNEEELLSSVARNIQNPQYVPANGFSRTCEYQKGTACDEVLKFILK